MIGRDLEVVVDGQRFWCRHYSSGPDFAVYSIMGNETVILKMPKGIKGRGWDDRFYLVCMIHPDWKQGNAYCFMAGCAPEYYAKNFPVKEIEALVFGEAIRLILNEFELKSIQEKEI